jgi:hypothetical protein
MFDLLTNKKVTELTLVPENLRGLYKPAEGGGFEQRNEDAGVASAIAAITGLAGALAASRKEAADALRAAEDAKTAVPDLTPLREYGDNPTAIAASIKETMAGLRDRSGVAKEIDRIRAEMTAANAAALGEKDKAVATLTQQLHRRLVDAEVDKAAAAAGVDADLIRPHVVSSVRVVTDAAGQFKAVVMENDGAQERVRYSTKTAGAEMNVGERVAELLATDKFKVLVPSKAPRGGSAGPVLRTAANTVVEKSYVEKIAAGLKKLPR